MLKLTYRRKDAFLGVGGLLGTLGGFLVKLSSHPVLVYAGYALTLIGIALLTHGTIAVKGRCAQVIDQWSPKLLESALASAPPDATIRILQTSIPDVTRLIGLLEDLLIQKKKQFRLRILLLDHENMRDVLRARVRLRVETADTHAAEIRANTDQFIRLKERVDAAWLEERSGASLNLQIRYYDFLPFGSMFQIGEERIFSGIFWNWTSSINGPMVMTADTTSNTWKCFEKQFTHGWETARTIYPPADAALSRAGRIAGQT